MVDIINDVVITMYMYFRLLSTFSYIISNFLLNICAKGYFVSKVQIKVKYFVK